MIKETLIGEDRSGIEGFGEIISKDTVPGAIDRTLDVSGEETIISKERGV